MATKDVYLYDSTNSPLAVGVTVELAETASGALLDKQIATGMPGGEWNVTLSFSPVRGAVEIYITDPSYRYPGNMVRSINGKTSDQLRLDLSKLPTSASTTASIQHTTIKTIGRSIKQEKNWSNEERDAVVNLCFNYASLVARVNLLPNHELGDILANWQEALRRLRIPTDIFS